jgi:exonuclease SbcD
MRILHTSDWHAGRIWKGVRRIDELARALDGVLAYVERERIDLVLITGDLFDSTAPPADAEQLVFRFLERLGALRVPSVVIAGNHDHPARVDAWGRLAILAGVRTLGRPRGPDKGGVVEIDTPNGRACVAMLPFAHPRYMVASDVLVGDDTKAAQTYAERFEEMVTLLCSRFRADTVNLLCAHAHMEGVTIGGTERRVHIGSEWAATAQALPTSAHYVALGHIHKPQPVPGAPQAEYAGSPMQMDFGEMGEDKSFVVIDAVPGRPAKRTRVPYEGTRRLVELRGALDEVLAQAALLQADQQWVRVVIDHPHADPDIARRVRTAVAGVVSVEVHTPKNPKVKGLTANLATLSPREVYSEWKTEASGGLSPEAALLDAFDELYTSCGGV